MKPQNFEESLIWYVIVCTYVIYVIGILFPVYTLLAWVLFFYLCKQVWSERKKDDFNKKIKISWLMWVWGICMVLILIVTCIGFYDFKLGTTSLIRGILGWLTTSAVLGVYFFSGCLNIRPQLIYRAICILCLQSLIAIPNAYMGYQLHLPAIVYSSPIERIIQNGPIYYNVGFYEIDYDTRGVRLSLFAPWCPALGLVSNVYFFLALQESNKAWRYIGIIGAIAMNIVSVSRSAFICLPLVLLFIWLLQNFTRPGVQIAAGFISFISGIFGTTLITTVKDFVDIFNGARVSSSRGRAALGRMALERYKEAPIWGHGIPDPGPAIVGHLPIGSHHTWIGLLFVKGLVGFIALLVPMVLTFIDLTIKALQSVTARVALSIYLTLLFFSFSEQIDVLAYMCFPGLIVMGIAFQEKASLLNKFDKNRVITNAS